jgi:hypothetical protein
MIGGGVIEAARSGGGQIGRRQPNQHGGGMDLAQGRSADAEEGAVEWYPPPDSGQLQGRHVLPGLQHPPPGAGQL